MQDSYNGVAAVKASGCQLLHMLLCYSKGLILTFAINGAKKEHDVRKKGESTEKK